MKITLSITKEIFTKVMAIFATEQVDDYYQNGSNFRYSGYALSPVKGQYMTSAGNVGGVESVDGRYVAFYEGARSRVGDLVGVLEQAIGEDYKNLRVISCETNDPRLHWWETAYDFYLRDREALINDLADWILAKREFNQTMGRHHYHLTEDERWDLEERVALLRKWAC